MNRCGAAFLIKKPSVVPPELVKKPQTLSGSLMPVGVTLVTPVPSGGFSLMYLWAGMSYR